MDVHDGSATPTGRQEADTHQDAIYDTDQAVCAIAGQRQFGHLTAPVQHATSPEQPAEPRADDLHHRGPTQAAAVTATVVNLENSDMLASDAGAEQAASAPLSLPNSQPPHAPEMEGLAFPEELRAEVSLSTPRQEEPASDDQPGEVLPAHNLAFEGMQGLHIGSSASEGGAAEIEGFTTESEELTSFRIGVHGRKDAGNNEDPVNKEPRPKEDIHVPVQAVSRPDAPRQVARRERARRAYGKRKQRAEPAAKPRVRAMAFLSSRTDGAKKKPLLLRSAQLQ